MEILFFLAHSIKVPGDIRLLELPSILLWRKLPDRRNLSQRELRFAVS
jgi:hypothetical protein